jgi:Fur family peroxide stress response transcriptional regulator
MIINREEITIESLAKTLADKGIRPSYQRIKVLEYLYQKGGHPTVDDIFCSLSPEIPSLSKVTIYNTLHTFINSGLVRCVDIDESEMCYDITLTNHGHFMCNSCGNIFNFEVDFDRIPIEGLAKFEIKEMNLYFKGFCPNCIKTTTTFGKGEK